MQRNLSIDLLKFGLAILVVAIHTGFLGDVSQQLCYILISGIFRIAVPIFFVINGYYFAKVLSSPSAWLKRGLILYLVWMLIYSYYWFNPSGINAYSLLKIVKTLLVGYEHLWYIASMLGAAVLLYYLRNLSSTLLLVLAVVFYIAGTMFQYLGNYHVFKGSSLDVFFNTLWIYRSPVLFAFPFFCIGYLIAKYQVQQKIKPLYLAIGVGVGLILVASESYINFTSMVKREGFDMLFSLLLVCPLVFMLFLGFNVPGKSKNIAFYSTAIYLVHFLIIIQLKALTELHHSILTLAAIVISLAVSFVLVMINQRVKYLL
ncbi:MAG: acyltransferase [Pseudomonadota bacterium]